MAKGSIGITEAEMKKILTTPLGEHPMDQFIIFPNVDAPWTPSKMDRVLGKGIPTKWIPAGRKEDDDRVRALPWDDDQVFFSEYVQKKKQKEISAKVDRHMEIWEEENQVLYAEQMAQVAKSNLPENKKKTAINKIDKEYRSARTQEERTLRKELTLDHLQNENLNRIKKAKNQRLGLDVGANLYDGRNDKKILQKLGGLTVEERDAQGPQAYYSMLASLYLGSYSPNNKDKVMKPRPLFGDSEKTMKNDGTAAEVRVMYLSPATRSDSDFFDEWLMSIVYPYDSDEVAKRKGLFPAKLSLNDFTNKFSSLGFDSKEQAQNTVDSWRKALEYWQNNGYNFYKTNPKKDFNLCVNPNTCPYAGACSGLCLVDSGQMGVAIEPQKAGYLKTWYWYLMPITFLRQLLLECVKESKRCKTYKTIFYGRLNGTSDITWERYINMQKLVDYCNANGGSFGGFYDYTKWYYAARFNQKYPANKYFYPCYDLTYSLSEKLYEELGGRSGCSFPMKKVEKTDGKYVDVRIMEQMKKANEWLTKGHSRVAVVTHMWKYMPQNLAEERPEYNDKGQKVKAGERSNKMATFFEKIPDLDSNGKPKKEDGLEVYKKDKNDFYLFEKITEQYTVTDFTDLSSEAINSKDPVNRGKQVLIVDADETDFRFNDPKPSICVLKPKGLEMMSLDRTLKPGRPIGTHIEKQEGGCAVENTRVIKPGEMYMSMRNQQTGKRFFRIMNEQEENFILTKEQILEFQRYVLSELNANFESQRYFTDVTLPQIAAAVNLKGGVDIQNIQSCLAPYASLASSVEENEGLFTKLQTNPRRKYMRKNPQSIVVYQDKKVGFFLVDTSTQHLVRVSRKETWDSLEKLEKALNKMGYIIDDNYNVVEK